MIKLPLNVPIEIGNPSGELAQTGIDKIIELVGRETGTTSPFKGIEWVWQTRAGNLPKRIASNYYRGYKISLTPEVMAKIGTLGEKYAAKSDTRIFDFTDTIDWAKGAFGDGDSCYFGNRREAFEDLLESGCLVMRHFEECDIQPGFYYGRYKGEGRCIVYPTKTDGVLALSNSYSDTLRLYSFARALATYIGGTYKKVDVVENCKIDFKQEVQAERHAPFLNGNTCIFVGDTEAMTGLTSSTFTVKPAMRRHHANCCNCKKDVHYQKSFHYSGGTFCESCLTECPKCKAGALASAFTDTVLGKVCGVCLKEYFSKCKACEMYVLKESALNYMRGCEACCSLEEMESNIPDEQFFMSAKNLARFLKNFKDHVDIPEGITVARKLVPA